MKSDQESEIFRVAFRAGNMPLVHLIPPFLTTYGEDVRMENFQCF